MHNPFDALMLAIEAQRVVELRLCKLAWGGPEAHAEMQLMVREKMSASVEAAETLMLGGSLVAVIARYRELVGANTKRLTGAQGFVRDGPG